MTRVCPSCRQEFDEAKEYKDRTSQLEGSISGLCQSCQIGLYGDRIGRGIAEFDVGGSISTSNYGGGDKKKR